MWNDKIGRALMKLNNKHYIFEEYRWYTYIRFKGEKGYLV